MALDLTNIPDLEVLAGSGTLEPCAFCCFDPDALGLLDKLSQALLSSGLTRKYPDLTSVAFFLRKRNLEGWRAYLQEPEKRRGRGLCLHIAPSNIPLNFAFSWIFGLLAGCSNIVRLPSRTFPEADAFIAVLREVLPEYEKLARSQSFVRYPRDSDATALLSEQADARLIWGGDATVKAIRALPARVWCTDICFTDRWSCALINPQAVLQASDPELRDLARRFYNDTYMMDQQACSSPQLIVWGGASREASKRFWHAVTEYAGSRYRIAAKSAVDKYTLMCDEAISRQEACGFLRCANLLTVEKLKALPEDPASLRGSCGYFFEFELEDSLAELFCKMPRKAQTLSVFGYDPKSVADEVIKSGSTCFDRVVLVGRAMDIGPVWDGHDLIGELSRRLTAE